MEEDADEFNEAFLGFLLNLHGAKDKAVRFRACQIIAGVLNGLGHLQIQYLVCPFGFAKLRFQYNVQMSNMRKL